MTPLRKSFISCEHESLTCHALKNTKTPEHSLK